LKKNHLPYYRYLSFLSYAVIFCVITFSTPVFGQTNTPSEIRRIPVIKYQMDEPAYRFTDELIIILSAPPDPLSDIEWTAGTSGVADIQAAFNAARQEENTQLGTSISMLTLPSQSEWDAMSDGDKALWLINRERVDRGIHPLHGLEVNVTSVAQYYANYLLVHNKWGHYEDGNSPWERLNENSAINACHDFLSVAENLAVFMTTGSSIPLPVERSIFNWMYDDGVCCSWGHRHAILWYPYNDNSGTPGMEGFLGIGRASGGPYTIPGGDTWNFAEMIVMNVFDPCSQWSYETDSDSDGIPDDQDTCTDTDGDGFGDPGFPYNTCEEDSCPDDSDKSLPGVCGCGVPDSGDADSDGVFDCVDQCNGDDFTGDTDTDGICNDIDDDDDNDGMPDVWEAQYGLDALIDDAEGDLDNDGFSNLKEYEEGTIPNNPKSRPGRGMPWLQLLLGD
jgi:hypothetical protein